MTLVQCNECGNRQETFGKIFFTCKKCGTNNLIENSRVEIEKPEDKTLEQNQEKEGEVTSLSSPPEIQEETLEIEQTEEQPQEKQKEIFRCPFCNAEVEKYKDCSNCGKELIWSEE